MKQPGNQHRAGQALLEAVIVMASMLALIVTFSLLLYVFQEHGGRILELVGSDYP